MDEALSWAHSYQNLPAVTARAETKFHKPVPVGASVTVKAWITQTKRRLLEAHAEIRMEGEESTMPSEAEATMYRILSAVATSGQEE